jgi:SAM-dependent methyltransferase
MNVKDLHFTHSTNVKAQSELDRIRKVYQARRHELEGKDKYSLFNSGHLFMIQQRQRAVLSLLKAEGFYPLAGRRILELGCGEGGVLREFLTYGASSELLSGIELLAWRAQKAGQECESIVQGNCQRLPYQDQSFDLLLQFTLFTSILDCDLQKNIAVEMLRVIRKSGLILWYDYWWNPINPDVRGIRKAKIRSLFPQCSVSFRRITLAPPLSRLLAKRTWIGCCLLESLKLLNTHYLAAIRPYKSS